MENIKNIVLFASVFSIILTILYNVSPEYNKSGQLKFISIIVYLALIISTIKNSSFNFDLNLDNLSNKIMSTDYTEEIFQQEILYETKTRLEENLLDMLEKNGLEINSINVTLVYNKDNLIEIETVSLENCSNYYKAKSLINQYFNDNVVIVNE